MHRYVIGFLAELAIWFGLMAMFLWIYVTHYAGPLASALPHVALSATVWLGLVSLRLALYRMPLESRFARQAGVALMTCAIACFILYYGAVLSGLEHWGRVISWHLIASYAPQLVDLIRALGMSPVFTLVTVIAFLLILLLLMCWVNQADWVSRIPIGFSPAMVPILIVAGLGFSSVRLYAFAAYPPVSMGEPLSLTFFPQQSVRRLQSVTSKSSALMDSAENRARTAYQPSQTARTRNVVLIVADALRPDHMSVNGYRRETTPYLDSLARLGQVRTTERMLATCAESSCGLLAISQGRFVHQFPNQGFTLQEVLKRHGYQTWMILGGDHTNFYGLKELYGAVDRYFDGSQAKGKYINDDQLVIDYVKDLPDWNGAPVMMQFHLMSSHGLGSRRNAAKLFEPSVNYYNLTDGREVVRSRKPDQRVINYYDNGVRSLDGVIHDLLSLLTQKGYLDEATVVITGDHGELLGEHGEFSHARTVYEAVLRIPFLMINFGYDDPMPLSLDRVASQADIAPTILRELDMPPPVTWSGLALQGASSRDFIQFQQGTQVGLVDLRDPTLLWKYVMDVRTGEELAFNITENINEDVSKIEEVASDIRRDWRRQVMEAAASVIVQ